MTNSKQSAELSNACVTVYQVGNMVVVYKLACGLVIVGSHHLLDCNGVI